MISKQEAAGHQKPPRTDRESVIIRFAGDSGDGIQLTGKQFTNESALAGNDIATLPNFPAEIRAPAGTLAGVSGYQIHFGSEQIFTPGESPDVLVAFNPAALKANLQDVKRGGILVLNEDAFTDKNLARVAYQQNPCDDESLKENYRVFVVPISKLTKEALSDTALTANEIDRCKNFFALGVMLWMFDRPRDATIHWIESKFKKRPELVSANKMALEAGYTYGDATEIFDLSFSVKPADLEPGLYRNINGSTSLAYGIVAAAQKSGLSVFFGAYPITPASDLLHELAKHKRLGIMTFQAEDEIAAICSAIGASYAGSLGVTSSSGPGIALKGEALGLAVCTELPLVVVNTQRAGPSTGMPTKTEQSDLLMALHGRHGEAPVCVLAASSPSTAFTMAYEACRIALKYMTPVILLSDGYIANGSEPWKIPDPKSLPEIINRRTLKSNNPDGEFLPYLRDEATLARPWAVPGTPGLMHRIGGLEKQDVTGNVSYDADNHSKMTALRAEKIAKIAAEIPPIEVDGPSSGEILLLGWGGTEGTLREAQRRCSEEGLSVSRIHLHYLNPLPSDLETVLRSFKHVLIPEINTGQLRSIIRDRYLIDAKGYNAVRGQPLRSSRVVEAIKSLVQPH
ncbi:MAG: 2-oxoacid:acceptor oxidoreductase subunit alpha [Bdellovibrionales bacterium]|nr:2-oxoacid:acceptor oxidoreductase subunit alpha [Bdellovibrionales bacterium]